MDAEKAHYPVTLMCRVLGLSRAGYYAWQRRPAESARDRSNSDLLGEIKEIHEESYGTYGSPRVFAELRVRGHQVGENRVARVMRMNGITARMKRRFRSTTDSRHDLPVAPNVLDRRFSVEGPNQTWVTDITYVWTLEGWLYLAVVVDLYSRRVVGWSMADHMRTELVMRALSMALGNRQLEGEILHHSDRGSQYASYLYQQALKENGLVCSMSRKGDCYDNAVVESFFGTLKTELIHRQTWPTRASARSAIHDYIEIFYNRKRRHSSLGYCSPAEFEAAYENANVA